SEEHTSELQSLTNLVCRLLLEKKKNREQRRIVEAISRRRDVLVQGPPGADKSHEIANLMCHLLAYGVRVVIRDESGQSLHTPSSCQRSSPHSSLLSPTPLIAYYSHAPLTRSCRPSPLTLRLPPLFLSCPY